MSDTSIASTAAAGDAAATEGVESPHAVESSNVMIAGEQTCASCASYAQELESLNERNDALTLVMEQMENDAIVSTTLANQREQQMFSSKAESEATLKSLQGDYELLKLEAQQSEQEARHACSELEQATENNFCFDPAHAVLQEDLDSARCEITQLRTTETTLEQKITALKEKVAEMQNHTASTLGRKIEQGRKKSSGLHPTMSALLKEEGADGEDPERMITGSELVIAGGIPKKTGDMQEIYLFRK